MVNLFGGTKHGHHKDVTTDSWGNRSVRRPLPLRGWIGQWRRKRACREKIGHCWHPENGMGVDWWCCECAAMTDGMPPDGCRWCRAAREPILT